MRFRKLLVVLALLLALVAGCGGAGGVGFTPPPHELAQQWFEAIGEFDVARMYELTHPQKRAELEAELEDPFTVVGATLGLLERDFFEMNYTVIFNDGETAQVRVTGKATSRLAAIDDVYETIDLRKLEGRWYIWSAEGGP